MRVSNVFYVDFMSDKTTRDAHHVNYIDSLNDDGLYGVRTDIGYPDRMVRITSPIQYYSCFARKGAGKI